MKNGFLSKVQKNVRRNTPFRLEIKERGSRVATNHIFHFVVKLHLDHEALEFSAEVKKEIRPHHLPDIYQLAEQTNRFLLIGGYINPKVKLKLKERDISWLDGAGNLFIKGKKHFIYVDRGKNLELEEEKDRAFTKTGLKVVFLFLLDETWLQKTYREIAEAADVSLGTIGYVLKGLEKRGFLVRKNEETYQLVQKEQLVENWISAYETELKPRIHVGDFDFVRNEQAKEWKKLELDDDTVWGGEAGAELLAKMLKPKYLTLYTEKSRGEIMQKYQLKPSEEGFVKVYKPYWKLDKESNIAPALSVYADLRLTGDERNYKIAKKIYEEYIGK